MKIEVCQGLNIDNIDFILEYIYIAIYYCEMERKTGLLLFLP